MKSPNRIRSVLIGLFVGAALGLAVGYLYIWFIFVAGTITNLREIPGFRELLFDWGGGGLFMPPALLLGSAIGGLVGTIVGFRKGRPSSEGGAEATPAPATSGNKLMGLFAGVFKMANGAVFGATSGFLLTVLLFFMVATPKFRYTDDGPLGRLLGGLSLEHGDEFIVLGPSMGGLFGALVGAVLGFLCRKSRPAAVAIATTGYGLVIGLALFSVLSRNYQEQRKVEKAQDKQERIAEWDSTYNAAYPKKEESLPKLLGPLHYPGSRVANWTDVHPSPTIGPSFGWTINVTTEDNLDSVLAHYMAVLPHGLDGEKGATAARRRTGYPSEATGRFSFSSGHQPIEDDRSATVEMGDFGDATRIRFEVRFPTNTSPRTGYEPPTAPKIPHDATHWREDVLAFQQPGKERANQLFEPFLPPDSQMVAASLSNYYVGRGNYQAFYRCNTPLDAVTSHLRERMEPPAPPENARGLAAMGNPDDGLHYNADVDGPPGEGYHCFVEVCPDWPSGGVLLLFGARVKTPEQQ